MRNKVTEKWIKTGLLDNTLDEIDKMLLSNNLEQAAITVISNEDTDNRMDLRAALFIPIIVRLFHEKNLRVIEDALDLYNKFRNIFTINYDLFFGPNNTFGFDGETEFCEYFVKSF